MQSKIGTLNEKPLHAALKESYARPNDQLEVPLEGYHIDIVQDGLLIEIQTGSFSPLKKKLRALVRNHSVLLVYPIPYEKWIITRPQIDLPILDMIPEKVTRRKSPKRGSPLEIFHELVYIPDLLQHPNFEIEVAMTREEEVRQRRERPKRKRRGYKKGWTLTERRLLDVAEKHRFAQPADLLALLPNDLPQPFTTATLAKALGRRRNFAQKVVYALRHTDALEIVGKEGNAYLYISSHHTPTL